MRTSRTFGSTIRTATLEGNAPLTPEGSKPTLNSIEAAASLAAEARRKCESLMAAACQSEDIKEAQLAFFEKRKHTSSAASAGQSPSQTRPS